MTKYISKRRPGSSGQTWKTFLRNHAAGIAATDFLVVPTINFRLLSVLVVLRHERRQLISLSVTDHPTADWIAQQITEAFPWDEAPSHLIRDRDAAVRRDRWKTNPRWTSSQILSDIVLGRDRGEENAGVVLLSRLVRVLKVPVAELLKEPEPGAEPPKPPRAGRKPGKTS